jgi:hypothetical protein
VVDRYQWRDLEKEEDKDWNKRKTREREGERKT